MQIQEAITALQERAGVANTLEELTDSHLAESLVATAADEGGTMDAVVSYASAGASFAAPSVRAPTSVCVSAPFGVPFSPRSGSA